MDNRHDQELPDFGLAAEEVMAAIRELSERGGLDDVFGRLPAENSSDLPPDLSGP